MHSPGRSESTLAGRAERRFFERTAASVDEGTWPIRHSQ